ncbi:MAG: hypothetical protein RL357_1524 [Pseudomonadota bacterium]|jgi:RimJ/RimL family protein N-acetyltransferase
MWQPLEPIVLRSDRVVLEPLGHQHLEGLCHAAQDGEVWRHWYTSIPSPALMATEIDRRLGLQAEGTMLPFAVVTAQGHVVGMTTYMNIDRHHQRLEIGSTWYAASVHRTGVNTHAKWLLLRHAFESLESIAVEFRTHWFNHQSRAAIERLGAKLDGVLRQHQKLPDGSFRDTVVYSIISSEWLAVKTHLEYQMHKPRPGVAGC